MAVRGNRLVEKQAIGYKNSKGEENFQGNRDLEIGVRNNESLASYLLENNTWWPRKMNG